MEKVRLDKYLAKVLGVPRAQIAHLIDKKMVLVNGVVAKKSEIVEESDKVEIAESSADSAESQNLNQNNSVRSTQTRPLRGAKNRIQASSSASADFLLEAEKRGSPPKSEKAAAFWRVGGAGWGVQPFLRKNKNNNEITESNLDSADSQNLPHIQRIYEDNDILVLNKPPFLATHGAPSLKEPSLVEWLKARKIQRSTISGELREGIVHRLDKQTSGALVVAKNNDAHNALSAQLADKTMGRLYLAIIDLPLKEDIEIECYLARNPKNRLKISKVDVRKYKKFAESSLDFTQNLPKFARYSKSKFYKLLPSKDGKKELILAKLFTGRTHQIRAHLESINRHIVGDELYGYKHGGGEGERVMLHAYLLELTHPKESSVGNSVLGMQFRTCENFRTSTDSSLVESPKIFTNTKATPQFLEFASVAKQPSLPLRFCESQNLGENQTKFAESALDSANPKLRFIAPLFDDMKDYLAKNFDMEKVYEILHGLPARAF